MSTGGFRPRLIVAFVIGCGAATVAQDYIVPPAAAQGAQQWEHYCEKASWDEFGGGVFKQAVGAQGWELATMTTAVRARGMTATVEVLACFKRPK